MIKPFKLIFIMRKTHLFLEILCFFSISSSVLAQTGPTAQDTMRYIQQQDSLEMVRLAQINAIRLTDSAT